MENDRNFSESHWGEPQSMQEIGKYVETTTSLNLMVSHLDQSGQPVFLGEVPCRLKDQQVEIHGLKMELASRELEFLGFEERWLRKLLLLKKFEANLRLSDELAKRIGKPTIEVESGWTVLASVQRVSALQVKAVKLLTPCQKTKAELAERGLFSDWGKFQNAPFQARDHLVEKTGFDYWFHDPRFLVAGFFDFGRAVHLSKKGNGWRLKPATAEGVPRLFGACPDVNDYAARMKDQILECIQRETEIPRNETMPPEIYGLYESVTHAALAGPPTPHWKLPNGETWVGRPVMEYAKKLISKYVSYAAKRIPEQGGLDPNRLAWQEETDEDA